MSRFNHIIIGLLSCLWFATSTAVAQEAPPAEGSGTYFESMRLNTQKFQNVKTGNYLREDYLCAQVPSACRDAGNQEAEDRWYPALPAYTEWVDDGQPHSHQEWTPAPSNQMADFQQERDYLQPQSRMRQEREQATPSGKFRTNGDPEEEVRDDARVERRTVTVNVLEFTPDGESFDCSTWLPEVNDVDWGDTFTQTRNCSQNATRSVQYFAGSDNIGSSVDSGVVVVEETQEATGQRDYVEEERFGEWQQWQDTGELYACGEWSPAPDSQPLGDTFIQTATCSIDQMRERQVFDVYASGNEVATRMDTETQTVSREDTREAVGSSDYIDSERVGEWENAWEIVQPQVNTNCDQWTPAAGTVDFGDSFTQTRTCDTAEEDFRSIYDVYKSGREEEREKERRTRVVQVQESQAATGTRDFVASTYEVEGEWVNQGNLYNCVWTPDPETIDVGETFTQTAQCDRNQTRNVKTMNVWASGADDSEASSRSESRTITEATTREQTGTGQPTISYGAWSAWSTQSVENCSAWAPSADTVNWGSGFTQTRDCEYQQQRTRSRTNTYPSGREEPLSDEVDARRLSNQTESQPAVGERDYEQTTRVVNGNWTDVGSPHTCTWTPDPSTIDVGQTFVQDGACKQNQKRTVTTYTVWASKPDTGKEDTVKSTNEETQVVDRSTTRQQTGAGQPVIEYGTWGGFTTYDTSCGEWTPGVATVRHGQAFTQTRSCTYSQERFRTRTNVYPSGRQEALSDQRDTRELANQTESQSATGEKEEEIGTYVTYSEYTNKGGVYGCTWSPSPETQDVGTSFTQTGDCSQRQERVATTWSQWASGKDDSVKSTQTQERVVPASPTRTEVGTGEATIEYGAWGAYSTYDTDNCSSWSPAESTVNLGDAFTQSRTCDYLQKRYRTRTNVYPSGRREALNSELGTRRLEDQAETRGATGTRDYVTRTYYDYTGWTQVANDKSCTAWTPSASSVDIGESFTQERVCQDGQQRYRMTMEEWASGKAATEKLRVLQERDVNDEQSRSQTGTGEPTLQCGGWSGYTTYSKSCGGWSPSESTVNLGQSFTQSRSCNYSQERTRTCEYVYPSGRREATTDGERETRVLNNQTETQSATGTKDYVVSEYQQCDNWTVSRDDYACGSWTPATSEKKYGHSFTQTRVCKEDRARNCRTMQRWSSNRADTVKPNSATVEGTTVNVSQSQVATGTQDYVTTTDRDYYDEELSRTCRNDWTPSTSTEYQGVTFTQKATQDLVKEYFYDQYDVYASGARVKTHSKVKYDTRSFVYGKEDSRNTLCQRTATGTAEPWTQVGGRVCDASTERDKGAPYAANGSSWLPAATSRGTNTNNYTQTRDGVQPREVLCYETETNQVTGQSRRVNERWEAASNDSYTFTRSVTVTRVGPENVGALTCGSYDQDVTQVCSGVTFTQSRTCTQQREYTITHKVNSATIHSLTSPASAVTSTDSRQAVGTKACGPECRYDTNNLVQDHKECQEGQCQSGTGFEWGGQAIHSVNFDRRHGVNGVIEGGYFYFPGALKDTSSYEDRDYDYSYETWSYEICREPQ